MLSTRNNSLTNFLSQPLDFSHCKKWVLNKTTLAIADQFAYSVGNFLTAVIVARNCSATDFGIYILGLRLVDYVREVQNVTIWTPYMLFSPRYSGEEHARYSGSALAHQLIFSLIVASLFLSAGCLIPGAIGQMMIPLALLGLAVPLQEFSRRICFANFQNLTALILDSSVTLFQLIGLYLCATNSRLTVDSAYWVIGIANASAALIWLWHSRSSFAFVRQQLIPDFKQNWEQGKWLFAGNVTLLTTTQIYPWALTSWHGAAAAGLYAASEGVINFIRALMVSIQNYLGPKLAHAYADGGNAKLKAMVNQATLFLGLLTGICASLLAFCGGELATLIYGKKFIELHWVIALLALNIFMCALSTAQSYALSTIERSDLNFKINTVGMILSATLGLAMTIRFGVYGAAVGITLSSMMTTVLRQCVFIPLFRKESQ